MLVLFCVKLCKLSTMNLVKEKKKKDNFLLWTGERYISLPRKLKKNLVNNIHKELKLNVDCNFKPSRNRHILQV
jgi:hypothetical protein